MAKRQGFYLYHDDVQALGPLSLEQKGKLLDALIAFSISGEKLKTDDMVLCIVFNLMSAKIARDIEKYEAKCRRLQLNAYGTRSQQKTADAKNSQQMQAKASKSSQMPESGTDSTKNVAVSPKGDACNCKQMQAEATKCQQLPADASNSEVTVTANPTVTATVTPTVTVNKEGEYTDPAPVPFVPPTIEEVEAYCEERCNQIDPVRFIMYYHSRGWKMGNTPMTDWKAAVQLWEKRDEADRRRQAAYQDAGPYDEEPVHWLQ